MEKKSPFNSNLPKHKRHKEIMKAVNKVLDTMEVGTKFSGSQLPKMCAAIEPLCKRTEGETIRRYLRYYRSRGKGNIVCIDKANSIYEKMAMEV